MVKLMLEELRELEKETASALIKLSEMKRKISEVYGMENEVKLESIKEIPFAAYEMQLERHKEQITEIEERHSQEKREMRESFDKEKDKIRKTFKKIVAWVAGITIAFIVGFFVILIYFFENYEFSYFTQDGNGINNYLGDNATQGDMNYEPVYPNNATSEEQKN